CPVVTRKGRHCQPTGPARSGQAPEAIQMACARIWIASSPSLLAMTNNLRLEIADAAGLLADADFKRFLRRGGFGARLGEIVSEGDDLPFGGLRDRVISTLADRIVRWNFQLFDVGADQYRALVGGEIPVRQAKAIDIQIEIVEILVFLVVEGFQRRRLIGLQ